MQQDRAEADERYRALRAAAERSVTMPLGVLVVGSSIVNAAIVGGVVEAH